MILLAGQIDYNVYAWRSAVQRVDGALRLCERTPPERNGHDAATISAAGIWVEGCFEPGTVMRLLVDVNRNATIV